MKSTRIMTALLSMILAVCMAVSMGMMTTAAQDVSDELSDVSGSAFGDIKTTYVVTLYWDDNNNASGTRPEEVTVLITANNGEFGSDYLYLNEENGWENVKNGLPVFYFKGPRTGKIIYEYEILDLPDEYNISIVQEGNWFKVTCSLNQQFLLGDADNDNEVSIVDALIVQKYDIGMPVNLVSTAAADVNCDQSVDIIDSTIIQRYLAGFDCSRYGFKKEK